MTHETLFVLDGSTVVKRNAECEARATERKPWNPWYRVHIDYAEDENGHYFILVDIHSRWPKIYFMQQNTSATTTIAISRELFAKYGLPVHCVVENSPQFRSEEFALFMKVNGVKRRCKYVSCLQIFVVIVSYKIFKCDSINVFKAIAS